MIANRNVTLLANCKVCNKTTTTHKLASNLVKDKKERRKQKDMFCTEVCDISHTLSIVLLSRLHGR